MRGTDSCKRRRNRINVGCTTGPNGVRCTQRPTLWAAHRTSDFGPSEAGTLCVRKPRSSTKLVRPGSRRPRKRSNRQWKTLLDHLCRLRVLDRDGHQCVRCGSTDWVQWSHVYTRKILCLRWDLRNSKALCASCHRWWHDNPAEAGPWWVEWAGVEVANDLSEIRQRMPKVDFAEVEQRLREGA